MTELKTLLFATDFSTGAARACNIAQTLARLSGARLHILHILTDSDAWPLQVAHEQINSDEQIGEGEVEMKRFIERYFPDQGDDSFELTYEIVPAHNTAEEIVHQAELMGASMVLMGTEGRSGMKRFFTGSTAEAVVRTAPVPVLTVREDE